MQCFFQNRQKVGKIWLLLLNLSQSRKKKRIKALAFSRKTPTCFDKSMRKSPNKIITNIVF
jgi:hypothetical protein